MGDYMIKQHQFVFSEKDNKIREFEKLGIYLTKAGNIYSGVMRENEELWPLVKQKLDEARVSVSTVAIFTRREILSAEWAIVFPRYISEYPMPDDDFEYKNISFTGTKQCRQCGIGLKQLSPIYLKNEPKLNRNNFMGINWTFDIFASPEVFEVFRKEKITGFEKLNAFLYGQNRNVESVQQLFVPYKNGVNILPSGLKRDEHTCGHIKYEVPKVVVPKLCGQSLIKKLDFVRTEEWFGSGCSARNLILCSNRFIKLYHKQRWRGLSFWPVEVIEK